MVGTFGVIATIIIVLIFSVLYYKFFKYCIRTRLDTIKIPEEEMLKLRYEAHKRRLYKQAKDVEMVYIERQ